MGTLRRDLAIVDDAVDVDIATSWDLMTPNGGYLGALCMSAAVKATPRRAPTSIACTFLSSPRSGRRARLDVEVLRGSKLAEAVGVDLVQGDRRVLRTTTWMRALDAEPALEHEVAPMPAYPPPLDVPIVERSSTPRKAFPFWDNIEERRLPVTDGRPEWTAWYRFVPEAKFGDGVLDNARALILLDVLALPATVAAHPSEFQVATTLQTDVLFCGSSAAHDTEWLLVHIKAPVSSEGFLFAHGAVWSEAGRLLAHGQTVMAYIGPVVER